MGKIWNVIRLCFSGVFSLVQDGASTFALLCLVAVTVVTLVRPQIGPAALAAYLTVVPGVLAYCSHRITLAQLGSQITTTSTNPPVASQTTVTTVSTDLPPNGVI